MEAEICREERRCTDKTSKPISSLLSNNIKATTTMLFSSHFLACLTLLTIVSANPMKRNSHSWAGTNNYFLHGLSDSDQTNYINSLASDGVKVVRLWVTGLNAGGCEKYSTISKTVPQLETTIGSYNNATLDALDATIVKLAEKNIKVIISPHDGNVICGSNGCVKSLTSTRQEANAHQQGRVLQYLRTRVLLRTASSLRCI